MVLVRNVPPHEVQRVWVVGVPVAACKVNSHHQADLHPSCHVIQETPHFDEFEQGKVESAVCLGRVLLAVWPDQCERSQAVLYG